MIELLNYNFFVNALIGALLASIVSGIIGAYMVARRMVFVGGGITHSSFGGIGIAYFLGLNPLLGAAVFAVLSALGINYFTKSGNVRQDSSIAIWWSLGMAVGIIFIALTPGYAPNLMSFLFGSILTINATDLWFLAILTIVVVALFTLFFNQIKIIAFDEDFARAKHLPVNFFNNVLLAIIAMVIVATIRISGIILLLSLLTLPQATANLFTNRFSKLILLSIGIGFIGVVTGLFVSYYTNLPSGATIILVHTALFLLGKVMLITRKSKTK